VELTAAARDLAAQQPEMQADIETALHGYVDRLSTCRGVLNSSLLQHYEVRCQGLRPEAPHQRSAACLTLAAATDHVPAPLVYRGACLFSPTVHRHLLRHAVRAAAALAGVAARTICRLAYRRLDPPLPGGRPYNAAAPRG
jgi:hypothetical protein